MKFKLLYNTLSQQIKPTVFTFLCCGSNYITIVYDTRPACSVYIPSLLHLASSKTNFFKNIHFLAYSYKEKKKKKLL